ncbi:MAG: hypothetical protein WAW37_10090 [Syntrophobacteraceae bacterium]
MNLPTFVCPHNESLLGTLSGQTVAVRVTDPAQAARAAECVWASGNSLFCVIAESGSPFCDIELDRDLKDIPLAVMAPSMGKFRQLAKRIEMLREFDLRVYLPCADPENIRGLRILSSVGVHGCAVIEKGMKTWDELADLMTYAVLERVPHASVEPFTFIASNYDPFSPADWGFFHFDDPKRFLHLDTAGRVALSRADLAEGRFVAPDISEIPGPELLLPVQDRTQARRSYFVGLHPCACCPGWKLCLGKFEVPGERGCSAFFSEMVDVARRFKARNSRGGERRIWQP